MAIGFSAHQLARRRAKLSRRLIPQLIRDLHRTDRMLNNMWRFLSDEMAERTAATERLADVRRRLLLILTIMNGEPEVEP